MLAVVEPPTQRGKGEHADRRVNQIIQPFYYVFHCQWISAERAVRQSKRFIKVNIRSLDVNYVCRSDYCRGWRNPNEKRRLPRIREFERI